MPVPQPDHSSQALPGWLRLLHTPGIGTRGFLRLLERFGSPQAVFDNSPGELRKLGLAETTIDQLGRGACDATQRDLEWLEGEGRGILTLHDPRYPPMLAEIPDPPPLLFTLGDPAHLNQLQIAMVGSRNPTRGGSDTARDFARHLARSGLTVTSGLALGIDAASHEGALQGGGATVAVAGTGLDRVYPARHKALAHRIAEQGVLVSEFPPGTGPLPDHFPRRNRIISGLSLGTLVVEAAQRSGSLITARLAMEQGREVFAIPGSIHNPLARGCHRLIRDGAKLVETAADILEELGPLALAQTLEQQANAETGPEMALDDDYQRLLDALGFDTLPIDSLVERSGLPPNEVASMLLLLEMRGMISAMPGGNYARTSHETQ